MRLFIFAFSFLLISSQPGDVTRLRQTQAKQTQTAYAQLPARCEKALGLFENFIAAGQAPPEPKDLERRPALVPSRAKLAFVSFTALFNERPGGLPEDVRVLGVRIRGGHLTVNLSEEFLSYGGNENEMVFIGMLKETAREIPGTTHLTLLIEGTLRPLPEGRLVDEMPV